MGLFSDTVPRDLHDALQTRYDDLLAKYHSLRPTHAPVQPMRQTTPRVEGEARIQQMERDAHSPRVLAVAENLKRQKPDLSNDEAIAEAVRLDGFVRGKDVPEYGGGIESGGYRR